MEADYTGSKFSQFIMTGCNMRRANFSHTWISETDFSGSDFTGTNFHKAIIDPGFWNPNLQMQISVIPFCWVSLDSCLKQNRLRLPV
ncbi:MAG: pentapeptide repeat-containing protein [Myxacorys californica WJT36-NPBG1]|nr:pentapeptide repeat-containing protein [Myxacorys californica WJT36-NPBG1]